MKILVIDDTKVHLDAALQTLAGHDVTVCSTHEEAYKLLAPMRDKAKFDDLFAKYGAGADSWDRANTESRLPYWDVVLCDLLMPAGPMAQGGEGFRFIGQEMAVGWSLALTAAKYGAKYVAVVTDMNHHNHPASAMLDSFNRHYFSIDGARVLMTNYVGMVGINGTECACKKCGGTGKTDGGKYDCHRCKNGVDYSQKGKDWRGILEQLLGTAKED